MSSSYKCESCGGNLFFDVDSRALKCGYCGSGKAIVDDSVANLKRPYSKDLVYLEDKDAVHIYECNSCHTTISTCSDVVVPRCVSCGDKDLKEIQAKGVRPDAIIPFKVSKNSATEIFKKWLKSRKFAPNNLKKMAKLQKISGFYTPVYSFDLVANTSYSAVGVNEWKDKDGETHESRWPVSGDDVTPYVGHLVSANSGVSGLTLNKFGGYIADGAVEYKSEYMLGFNGTGTQVDVHQGYSVLNHEIAEMEKNRVRSELRRKYDDVDFLKTDTTLSNVFNCYYYAPIWANHYKYKGKDYHCYINGQTGKVYGKSPKSVWKILALVLGIVAGVALLAFLFS